MPYAESWLKWEEMAGGRATLKGSTEEMRGQYDQLVQALIPLMPPVPEGAHVVECDVDGVKYRNYTPKKGNGPFPIAIWTHGGGYMLGDLNSDDILCRVVAENTKSAVVNVDYRLAPEHAWPAQLEDSSKVYKWAVQNAATFGGDPSKIYTIGGSAGGGLALQVANQVLRDSALKGTLKSIIALVPVTAHWESIPDKYKSDYKAYEDNAHGTPVIDKESMDLFYKAAKADPHDASCFTLLATDKHAESPPVYFTSCEFDPLRDDAKVMEKALNEAGVRTKHDYYPGFPHYLRIFPPIPEGQEFVGKMVEEPDVKMKTFFDSNDEAFLSNTLHLPASCRGLVIAHPHQRENLRSSKRPAIQRKIGKWRLAYPSFDPALHDWMRILSGD